MVDLKTNVINLVEIDYKKLYDRWQKNIKKLHKVNAIFKNKYNKSGVDRLLKVL